MLRLCGNSACSSPFNAAIPAVAHPFRGEAFPCPGKMESCAELFAAKNEAGYIIRLARGTDKFVYLLHQELQGLLCIPIRQVANGAEPALVSEFFSRLIESLDHAIGEKNQGVARFELQRCSFINNVGTNAKWQAADFQRFNRAVRVAENRGVVSGIDVDQPPRYRVVFRENRSR